MKLEDQEALDTKAETNSAPGLTFALHGPFDLGLPTSILKAALTATTAGSLLGRTLDHRREDVLLRGAGVHETRSHRIRPHGSPEGRDH